MQNDYKSDTTYKVIAQEYHPKMALPPPQTMMMSENFFPNCDSLKMLQSFPVHLALHIVLDISVFFHVTKLQCRPLY